MNTMIRARGGIAAQLWFRAIGIVGSLLLQAPDARADWPPVIAIEDPFSRSCEVDDLQPGLITVNVVLNGGNIWVSGAAFRIGSSAGFTGVLLSEQYRGGSSPLGNVNMGVGVAFNSCLQSYAGIEIVKLTYQVFGTSTPCSVLEVLPRPGEESIVVADCNSVIIPTRALGPMFINYNTGCGNIWCVLATEPTTWGRVKALYR
jgi:hypothetical protein